MSQTMHVDSELSRERNIVLLESLTADELMALNFANDPWLVEGLIRSGGITQLFGLSGIGKSWIYLLLAIAVATGKPLFGQFPTLQGSVVVIDEENDEQMLQERLALLGYPGNLPIRFFCRQSFTPTDSKMVGEMLRVCDKDNAKLVIIDSLIAVHRGEENSADKIRATFRGLQPLHGTGRSVFITHHSKRPGSDKDKADDPTEDYRGSSDIKGALYSQISMRKSEDVMRFQQTKNRNQVMVPPFTVRMHSFEGAVHFDYQGASSDEGTIFALQREILSFFSSKGLELNQTEAIEELKAAGISAGEKAMAAALNLLVRNSFLIGRTGNGKTIYYSLPPDGGIASEQRLLGVEGL